MLAAIALAYALAPSPLAVHRCGAQLPLARATRVAMEEGVASLEPIDHNTGPGYRKAGWTPEG